MSCIGWNCRGLGNPPTVQVLIKEINLKQPTFLFLSETRLLCSELYQTRVRLGFDAHFGVDCDLSHGGRRGGLCLLWKEGVDVNILSASLHHIDALMHGAGTSQTWRFSGIYGWAEEQNKPLTWQLLQSLADQDLPWLCLGDFNEILYLHEKQGGHLREHDKMEAFRSVLGECGLEDLGFKGFPFTWTNGQKGNDNIQERLDRCLANGKWQELFPHFAVEHLVRLQSDHSPLLTIWNKKARLNSRRKRKPFRFEAMWLHNDTCPNVIQSTWMKRDVAASPPALKQKLGEVATALKEWEKINVGHVSTRINDLSAAISCIQQATPSHENIEQLRALEGEHRALLILEESLWKQRSRMNWLSEGDKNTAFFHRAASGRRRRNSIDRIKDSNDQWEEDPGRMEDIFLSYFENIFTTELQNDVDDVISSISRKINLEEATALSKNFTEEDVIAALNQMHPLKAPGPDGMPALFYSKFWSVIKPDLLAVVLGILNAEVSPSAINQTHITLIPKTKHPETPKDFRPISLCNVAFKLVTKCITNRLKPLLPKLINQAQSAFVPGRLITDNALIAFELFHTMKLNKSIRQPSFALKLDMSKAYDRVEWGFLTRVMERLGFPLSFSNLIFRCISSVSYSLLINGKPTRTFLPSRGLRQGDPLSPFLFLFCAEAFSTLIRKAEVEGALHGARVTRLAPRISHLFFADDCIIFGKAIMSEIATIKDVVSKFCRASGQRVNFDKSEISFSKGLAANLREHLGAMCGVSVVTKHTTYLGLPANIGRSKKDIFNFIIDRVEKKLKCWKARSLSQAGRLVLIKSVAQAIPSFVMSCFLLPKATTNRLNQITANFWWGQKTTERKIHWCNWNSLCSSKTEGGTGLRDLESFNLGFLAKQGWRMLTHPDSLLAQCFSARYFPRGSFLEAQVGHSPSFTWRSILAGRNTLKEGILWSVRDGQSINIWKDPWIPKMPHFLAPLPYPRDLSRQRVRDLMDEDGTRWDSSALAATFPPHIVNSIMAIPISSSNQSDCIRWMFSKDGQFTVKSAYWAAKRLKDVASSTPSSSSNNPAPWKWFWHLRIPHKVKIFLWRCMRGILQTKVNLQRRGSVLDATCPRCCVAPETMDHVLRDCQWSFFFWRASILRIIPPCGESRTHLQEWILQTIQGKNTEFIEIFGMLLWSLWKARNSFVFQDSPLRHIDAFNVAISTRADFQRTNLHLSQHRSPSSTSNWAPPPHRWIKINSDASLGLDGAAGIGGVFRDHGGVVTKVFTGFLPFCDDVEIAEAAACRNGIHLAVDMGVRALVVEVDNLSLATLLQKNHIPRSPVGTIIADILHAARSLDLVTFCWTHRSCNSVANEVARLARNPNSFVGDLDTIPASVRHLADVDVAYLRNE